MFKRLKERSLVRKGLAGLLGLTLCMSAGMKDSVVFADSTYKSFDSYVKENSIREEAEEDYYYYSYLKTNVAAIKDFIENPEDDELPKVGDLVVVDGHVNYKGIITLRDSVLNSQSSENSLRRDKPLDEEMKDASTIAIINTLRNLDLDPKFSKGINIHISPYAYTYSVGLCVPSTKGISIHPSNSIGPEMAKYYRAEDIFVHEMWHAIEDDVARHYKNKYGRDLIEDYSEHYEKFANGKYKNYKDNHVEDGYDREFDIHEAMATDFVMFYGDYVRKLHDFDIVKASLKHNKDSKVDYNENVSKLFEKALYGHTDKKQFFN